MTSSVQSKPRNTPNTAFLRLFPYVTNESTIAKCPIISSNRQLGTTRRRSNPSVWSHDTMHVIDSALLQILIANVVQKEYYKFMGSIVVFKLQRDTLGIRLLEVLKQAFTHFKGCTKFASTRKCLLVLFCPCQ